MNRAGTNEGSTERDPCRSLSQGWPCGGWLGAGGWGLVHGTGRCSESQTEGPGRCAGGEETDWVFQREVQLTDPVSHSDEGISKETPF